MSEWQVNENKAWFHKWWPKGVPLNIQFEKISLGDLFERQRRNTPLRILHKELHNL